MRAGPRPAYLKVRDMQSSLLTSFSPSARAHSETGQVDPNPCKEKIIII